MAFSADNLKKLQGEWLELQDLIKIGVLPVQVTAILIRCSRLYRARIAGTGWFGSVTELDKQHARLDETDLRDRWGIDCMTLRFHPPQIRILDAEKLIWMLSHSADVRFYNTNFVWGDLTSDLKG